VLKRQPRTLTLPEIAEGGLRRCRGARRTRGESSESGRVPAGMSPGGAAGPTLRVRVIGAGGYNRAGGRSEGSSGRAARRSPWALAGPPRKRCPALRSAGAVRAGHWRRERGVCGGKILLPERGAGEHHESARSKTIFARPPDSTRRARKTQQERDEKTNTDEAAYDHATRCFLHALSLTTHVTQHRAQYKQAGGDQSLANRVHRAAGSSLEALTGLSPWAVHGTSCTFSPPLLQQLLEFCWQSSPARSINARGIEERGVGCWVARLRIATRRAATSSNANLRRKLLLIRLRRRRVDGTVRVLRRAACASGAIQRARALPREEGVSERVASGWTCAALARE
jgi:hypothetical protein